MNARATNADERMTACPYARERAVCRVTLSGMNTSPDLPPLVGATMLVRRATYSVLLCLTVLLGGFMVAAPLAAASSSSHGGSAHQGSENDSSGHGGWSDESDEDGFGASGEAEWGDDETGEGEQASLLTGSWRAKKDVGLRCTRRPWLPGRSRPGTTASPERASRLRSSTLVWRRFPGSTGVRSSMVQTFRTRASAQEPATSTATVTAPTWPGSSRVETSASAPDRPDPERFAGVAPGAQIVNVKVGHR